jgi:SAM-dependent methyltransferase
VRLKRAWNTLSSVQFKRAWDTLFLDPHAHALETLSQLPLFAPGSGGPLEARARLTLLSANQTFPFLVNLLREIGRARLIDPIPLESFCSDQESRDSASRLQHLLDKHGSDKARIHDYHRIYGAILKDAPSVTTVLEIGIGSNNPGVVSRIGRGCTPGASLRAFRDHLPNATIYGADIDREVLFEEERIRTFFVDQTDLDSLDVLGENIGQAFDLIIDDGLHCPNANIAVLAFSVKKLKPGGWVVVEDIVKSAVPVWQVVAALLPPNYEPHLISAKAARVFAVKAVHTDLSGPGV